MYQSRDKGRKKDVTGTGPPAPCPELGTIGELGGEGITLARIVVKLKRFR